MAWLKIAHATGIGRSAVRLINTDDHGRMNLKLLQETVAADIHKNFVPVLIAATAGTTNAGMIAPLKPCREIARQYDTWFHVDAACSGALIANDNHRDCLDGIEQADSITIDAHKWFATTMRAGMFLTRSIDRRDVRSFTNVKQKLGRLRLTDTVRRYIQFEMAAWPGSLRLTSVLSGLSISSSIWYRQPKPTTRSRGRPKAPFDGAQVAVIQGSSDRYPYLGYKRLAV